MFATIFSSFAMNAVAFMDSLNLMKWLKPDFDDGFTALFRALCWYIELVVLLLFCKCGEFASAGLHSVDLYVTLVIDFCFLLVLFAGRAYDFDVGFFNNLFLNFY